MLLNHFSKSNLKKKNLKIVIKIIERIGRRQRNNPNPRKAYLVCVRSNGVGSKKKKQRSRLEITGRFHLHFT